MYIKQHKVQTLCEIWLYSPVSVLHIKRCNANRLYGSGTETASFKETGQHGSFQIKDSHIFKSNFMLVLTRTFGSLQKTLWKKTKTMRTDIQKCVQKYNLSFEVTFPIQNRCISLAVHQRSVSKGSALLCTNTEKAISPWNRAFSDQYNISRF